VTRAAREERSRWPRWDLLLFFGSASKKEDSLPPNHAAKAQPLFRRTTILCAERFAKPRGRVALQWMRRGGCGARLARLLCLQGIVHDIDRNV